MMLDEGNDMDWPERPTHGHAEFTVWYEKVIRRFFDEVHTIKSVEPTIDGDTRRASRSSSTGQANVWEPPAPKSKLLHMDAFQTWEVVRDPASGKAVIKQVLRRLVRAEMPDSDGGLGRRPARRAQSRTTARRTPATGRPG